VVNIQPKDFVLAVGWVLNCLNPNGPYAHLNIWGKPGSAKTTVSRILMKVIDPNVAGLRKVSGQTDNLMIGAKNGWLLGWDNMSGMRKDWSDALCMLATGIAVGARRLYTDYEQSTFVVERPFVFNGKNENLLKEDDLADRTIRLLVPSIERRRTEEDVEAEFEEMWPRVLGAVLDGLVAAMDGWRDIDVEKAGIRKKAARFVGFERFAEAGCRVMGFGEWEFVKAYAHNQRMALVVTVENSAVGREVQRFMQKHPNGWAGKAMDLLDLLERWKKPGDYGWPTTPGGLSTKLAELEKPLESVGIRVERKMDRRKKALGGTQQDIVLSWLPQDAEAPESSGTPV
jgi:hypothetical protein